MRLVLNGALGRAATHPLRHSSGKKQWQARERIIVGKMRCQCPRQCSCSFTDSYYADLWSMITGWHNSAASRLPTESLRCCRCTSCGGGHQRQCCHRGMHSLLLVGSPLTQCSQSGRTPLHDALQNRVINERLVLRLIDATASVFSPDVTV